MIPFCMVEHYFFLLGTLPTLSSSLLRIHTTLSIIFLVSYLIDKVLPQLLYDHDMIVYTFTIATVRATNVGIMALQPRGHYTCHTIK